MLRNKTVVSVTTMCLMLASSYVYAVNWTVTGTPPYTSTALAPASGTTDDPARVGKYVWLGQMNSANTTWFAQKGVLIPSFTFVSGSTYSYTCSVDPEDANTGANADQFLVSRKDSMGMYVPDTVFIVDPDDNYPSYPGLAKSAAYIMAP